MRSGTSTAGAVVGGALLLLAARRILIAAAALAPPRPLARSADLPGVVLLVPARNEEASLARLLPALDRLDYPAPLAVVVVNDGSTDGTAGALASWSVERPTATVVTQRSRAGKARALNAGLAAAPPAEIVVVCDADLVPAPGSIRALVEPLGDPAVAAVAGYRRPGNADDGTVARYAAVESWVTQLVTSAGKDRLGLDPPTLGWAAFRRTALEEVGGFDEGAHGEDVAVAAALAARGWRTRFAPAAIADDRVVTDLGSYRRQHLRWHASTADARRSGPGMRRLEQALASTGYSDRAVLAAATALAVAGRLPARLPLGYAALRGVEAAVAVHKAGAGRCHVASTALFFPVDLVVTAEALARGRGRPGEGWESPTREPSRA